jgi:cyclopropane-fatty-acyl-phospholipid synthase
MTSKNLVPALQDYTPIGGDIDLKDRLGYRTTRLMAGVLNSTQMALAEAYVNGIEIPDVAIRSIWQTSMPILFKHAPGLLAPYEWVLEESSSEVNRLAESSPELMKLHYDLPQAMLNPMLGDWQVIYPKYSMGYWENGAKDLEESQIHMLDLAIERLGIVDGDYILDFGCGWGCVANYIMSKFPNVRFAGLNLSHHQCEYMRHKMEDPQSYLSSGRFTLHEGDLNAVDFTEKFDKIISIGVFCHVGNLTNAFQKLSALLKSNGKVFIHIITARIPNNMSSGFTHKYIFPHGRYWNYDAIPNHNRDLKTIDRWYMNGTNYHQTFAAWLQRFDDAQETVKSLDYGMDYAKFRRIWRFYLMMMGTAFSTCDGEYNGNGQYLMVQSDR